MDCKQLRTFKQLFQLGAFVKYNYILKRGYGEEESITNSGWMKLHKLWKKKLIPDRQGVVIGWRWLSNGKCSYSGGEGSIYTAIESIFAIEVKRGMMNKVDLVAPDDLNLLFGVYAGIPDRIPTFTDKDKQWLRDVMKDVPRDEKGRWR